MTTADKVIAWIEANYLGRGEPFPPKYGEWIPFQEKWGYPQGVVVEWCGGLLCEATVQTGGSIGNAANNTAPNTWWTVAGVQQFMQRGDWIPADGSQAPRRGDFIYFDWGGGGFLNRGDLQGANRVDHVGIVADASRWNAANNWRIDTIEGNIGERCGRFIRYDNATVVGFGRPRYSNVASSGTPAVQPAVVDPEFAALYGQVNGTVNLGSPTGPKVPFFGSQANPAQSFQKGIIVKNGNIPYAVYGGIFAKWANGEGGRVGLPTSSEIDVDGLPGARMNLFSTGGIVWSPKNGAHALNGPVWEHWLRLSPQDKAALGAPLTTTITLQPDLPGRGARFENGWLVYGANIGTHAVLGKINQVYERQGTTGLGYPLGPASQREDGKMVQRFTNGELIV